MATQNALGEFLRARRARLAPSDLDLPEYGPRRVPGLRREEVAAIAGLSPSYYTRIEQGVARAPSGSVLDALARALRLDPDERAHLHRLASPPRLTSWRHPGPPRAAARSVDGLVHLLPVPAMVLGRSLVVIDWNRPGHALLADPPDRDREAHEMPPRNLADLVLTQPGSEERFLDRSTEARQIAGYLRLQTARHPGDPDLRALVDRLVRSCPTFARHWDEHVVSELQPITTRIRHPRVGDLTLRRQVLRAANDPDDLLILFHALPGTPEEAALTRLDQFVSSTGARSRVPVGSPIAHRLSVSR